jgi:hypothetical protein
MRMHPVDEPTTTIRKPPGILIDVPQILRRVLNRRRGRRRTGRRHLLAVGTVGALLAIPLGSQAFAGGSTFALDGDLAGSQDRASVVAAPVETAPAPAVPPRTGIPSELLSLVTLALVGTGVGLIQHER